VSVPRADTVYYRRSRFTTHLPIDRRYSAAHYWLLEESAGVWRVGFTKFATRMLGDIVEFDFSVAPGAAIGVGDEIGSIEGLKAVTTVFSSGVGRFLSEGSPLRQDVTLAETDPYGKGWLYRLQGDPAPDTVDVHGYVALLDLTIDKMLTSRHADGDQ
jgi:glycine cleavage system H protein